MISANNGHVEIEGTGKTIFADYACITNALTKNFGAGTLFHGFCIGVQDTLGDDLIAVVQGRVTIPTSTRNTTLNLAMILNAIIGEHGGNAENIIKTAADIATIIKPDNQVDDIDAIGNEVIKMLEGIED